MKYTLCITQQCNLSCNYCYIDKKKSVMSLQVAEKAIDFAFKNTPPEEKIDIGFFGGEPLLEFGLIKNITDIIEGHPAYSSDRVELTVVTNGTIFSDEIAEFINKHNMGFCVSCDGPPHIHDMYRTFQQGQGSSAVVERTIRQALEVLPCVMVNAVYTPQNLRLLPDVIEYFSFIGVRQIYLNPDFSARWAKKDADSLPEVYERIAEQYLNFYHQMNPHFISLIDSKITVIMRGGYQPLERCRMGKGEFAFTPSGNIYPCERLIGSDDKDNHCIGNINSILNVEQRCDTTVLKANANSECQNCGLNEYCMNWCGCSNYFSTGQYNIVGPFLCASERTAILTAFNVYQTLEKNLGPTFIDHVAGASSINSIEKEYREMI